MDTWLKTTGSDLLPLQKYAVQTRKGTDEGSQYAVAGQRPKKQIMSNINYYDHNILGLENRTALKQTEMVQHAARGNVLSKSQIEVEDQIN